MYGTKRDNLSRRLNLSQRKKNVQHVGRLLRYLISVPQFLLPRVYNDDDDTRFINPSHSVTLPKMPIMDL